MTILKRIFLAVLFVPICAMQSDVQQNVSINKPNTNFFLDAPSSSGKSAIARTLAPMLKGTTEIVSFDGTAYEIARQRIMSKRSIKTPLTDTDFDNYFESLKDDDWTNFETDIEQQMYANIRKYYLAGKNVIVDTGLFEKDAWEPCLRSLHDLPILFVLVYCPLQTLFQFLTKRNQSEDMKEHRDLDQPFRQFFKIYKKRENSSQVFIDNLKQDQVDLVIKHIKKTAQQTEKNETELIKFLKAIDEQMPSIYKKFELDKYKEIEITPVLVHDLVVNTGVLTPKESAQKIINFLENKTPCKALQQNYEQLKIA